MPKRKDKSGSYKNRTQITYGGFIRKYTHTHTNLDTTLNSFNWWISKKSLAYSLMGPLLSSNNNKKKKPVMHSNTDES